MKILVVDDDASITEKVRNSLVAYSHTVDVSNDGNDGSFLARSYEYDAIVLDYSLPRKDGISICREIRSSGKTVPILFLSNTQDTDTKIAAFKAGADDYVTKPFSLDELKTRIDVVSRRAPVLKSSILKVGDLTFDTNTCRLMRGTRSIRLTKKEHHLIEYLMKNAGNVLSRAQIMEHIWAADSNPFSNTIEAHIRNLRRKLTSKGEPNMIENLPGRGYIIDTPENLRNFLK